MSDQLCVPVAQVQCHNSMELLAALASVPAVCASNPDLGAFRLLLIDDISAFHWLDIGFRADEPGSMSRCLIGCRM